jgi:hypothetical protein
MMALTPYHPLVNCSMLNQYDNKARKKTNMMALTPYHPLVNCPMLTQYENKARGNPKT